MNKTNTYSTILGGCWREKVVSVFRFGHSKTHFRAPENGHFCTLSNMIHLLLHSALHYYTAKCCSTSVTKWCFLDCIMDTDHKKSVLKCSLLLLLHYKGLLLLYRGPGNLPNPNDPGIVTQSLSSSLPTVSTIFRWYDKKIFLFSFGLNLYFTRYFKTP